VFSSVVMAFLMLTYIEDNQSLRNENVQYFVDHINLSKSTTLGLPMSSSSNGTSSPYKCKVEGEVMGLSPTGCIHNLPIKECKGHRALGL